MEVARHDLSIGNHERVSGVECSKSHLWLGTRYWTGRTRTSGTSDGRCSKFTVSGSAEKPASFVSAWRGAAERQRGGANRVLRKYFFGCTALADPWTLLAGAMRAAKNSRMAAAISAGQMNFSRVSRWVNELAAERATTERAWRKAGMRFGPGPAQSARARFLALDWNWRLDFSTISSASPCLHP